MSGNDQSIPVLGVLQQIVFLLEGKQKLKKRSLRNTAHSIKRDAEMKSILLVDYNRRRLQMTANSLQVSGALCVPYRITVANNADDAIARLKKEAFDLVITEDELPTLKGHELALWIHEHLPGCHLPVILMSDDQKADAINRTPLFSAMIGQGIITVLLPRPYRIQQLISMVNLVLMTRRKRIRKM